MRRSCERWVRQDGDRIIVYRSQGYGRRFGAEQCGGEVVVDVDYYDQERYGCRQCYREYISVRCLRCRSELVSYDLDDLLDFVREAEGLV